MRIAVVGGDRRFDLLAERLARRHDVLRDPEDLMDVEMVVAKDVTAVPAGGALITMGGAGVDLMRDEEFVRRNAVLTAEGAICAAMRATEGALAGSRCFVIGFGRIGRALAGMLKGFEASAIVAARRKESRCEAQQLGLEACGADAAELKAQVARADFIFSTPPAMLLTEDVLRAVRKGVPVIDLASPPYGVDLEAAQRLGLRAWRESGVPGRYCPEAAAALMEEFIENQISE